MSQPLLLERKTPGSGPQIPLGAEFDTLVVEGLAEGCSVWVDTGNSKVEVKSNCKVSIPKTIIGLLAQAGLVGSGSAVHVWLEVARG